MKVTIDVLKSVPENAAFYYEQAKRAKKKIEGAKKAYEETLKRIELAESRKKKEKIVLEARKKHWFEKFRWFISSDNKVVVGGSDATTNDILVKKYAEKGDLIFHTQLPGSPFVIIKGDGKEIKKEEIEEAAIFCASMSKSWSAKATTADVYYIKPEQVKKEFGLPKGSFMIYGQRTYLRPILELGCGVWNDIIPMCGPLTAIKKHCKKVIIITQGDLKKSDAAKKIRYILEKAEKVHIDLDEIMHILPPGDCTIKEM